MNFTPGRSLNSQVVSLTVFQETASRGLICCRSSWSSTVSKMCRIIELLGVRLWKCGSIAEGSAERPILSSWAPAAAIHPLDSATAKNRVNLAMLELLRSRRPVLGAARPPI